MCIYVHKHTLQTEMVNFQDLLVDPSSKVVIYYMEDSIHKEFDSHCPLQ